MSTDDETVTAIVELRMLSGSATYQALAQRLQISKTAAVARAKRLVRVGRLQPSTGWAGSLLPHHGDLFVWIVMRAVRGDTMCCEECRALINESVKKHQQARLLRTVTA